MARRWKWYGGGNGTEMEMVRRWKWHGGGNGTEVKIQLLLKRFSDPSIFSPIHRWLMPGSASGHQKLTPISMDRQLHHGDWSTSGRVNSCKVAGWLFTLGQTSNPSLAWKKVDVIRGEV